VESYVLIDIWPKELNQTATAIHDVYENGAA